MGGEGLVLWCVGGGGGGSCRGCVEGVFPHGCLCAWVVCVVGDRLVKVNGESVLGKTYSQVIALIQNR